MVAWLFLLKKLHNKIIFAYFVANKKNMKPYKFLEFILDEIKGLHSEGAAKNIIRALSANNLVDGRKDLTPTPASWLIYSLFGCSTTNYAAAQMWIDDRRDEMRQDKLKINENIDTPIYALNQFLAKPDLVKELKVSFFGFSSDGRLFIFREDATDILPKKIINEFSGEIEDSLGATSKKSTLVPAKVLFALATKLAFTPADLKKELKKVPA